MVKSENVRLDEVILEIFEEQNETFYFPVSSQKEARAFVKALHHKGISYELLCEEINEFEVNFTPWRTGLGRSGIGNRVIERINKPLQEVLLSDGEDEGNDSSAKASFYELSDSEETNDKNDANIILKSASTVVTNEIKNGVVKTNGHDVDLIVGLDSVDKSKTDSGNCRKEKQNLEILFTDSCNSNNNHRNTAEIMEPNATIDDISSVRDTCADEKIDLVEHNESLRSEIGDSVINSNEQDTVDRCVRTHGSEVPRELQMPDDAENKAETSGDQCKVVELSEEQNKSTELTIDLTEQQNMQNEQCNVAITEEICISAVTQKEACGSPHQNETFENKTGKNVSIESQNVDIVVIKNDKQANIDVITAELISIPEVNAKEDNREQSMTITKQEEQCKSNESFPSPQEQVVIDDKNNALHIQHLPAHFPVTCTSHNNKCSDQSPIAQKENDIKEKETKKLQTALVNENVALPTGESVTTGNDICIAPISEKAEVEKVACEISFSTTCASNTVSETNSDFCNSSEVVEELVTVVETQDLNTLTTTNDSFTDCASSGPQVVANSETFVENACSPAKTSTVVENLSTGSKNTSTQPHDTDIKLAACTDKTISDTTPVKDEEVDYLVVEDGSEHVTSLTDIETFEIVNTKGTEPLAVPQVMLNTCSPLVDIEDMEDFHSFASPALHQTKDITEDIPFIDDEDDEPEFKVSCNKVASSRNSNPSETVTEGYDSDLEADILNSSTHAAEKTNSKTNLGIQNLDGQGFIYVFTDSPNDAKKYRVKIGASRYPYKKLQQALLFNRDIRLVSATQCSRKKTTLQNTHDRLRKFQMTGTEDWFIGGLDEILNTVMDMAKQYPVVNGK